VSGAVQVVRLAATSVAAVGGVLARAFGDDPLMAYVLPDAAERSRLMPWYYEALVRYAYLAGEVHTTAGEVVGGAVWLPEGDAASAPGLLAAAGLLETPAVLGAGPFERLSGAVRHLRQRRLRDAPPAHWYLSLLGVEPARQGTGVGGALLRPMLVRADAEERTCYLETFVAGNVPFYRRYGFDVVTTEVEPRSGLALWTLRRPPAADPGD
jgi:GNAT superfamily N-acetyltransferase